MKAYPKSDFIIFEICMFRINYILKKPNTIGPWGETEKHLHWYGLTDGLLWINAGDSVIYEYAEPHADSLGIQMD